jgi:hypothetical protein
MAVELITSHGTLRVTLFCKDAPKTCRNFIELCKNGYYDGVIFHVSAPPVRQRPLALASRPSLAWTLRDAAQPGAAAGAGV